MKAFLIYSIIVFSAYSSLYSITQCKCDQLLSQSDCSSNQLLNCEWNKITSLCKPKEQQKEQKVQATQYYDSYCHSYDQNVCPFKQGCAWVQNDCTFFTGCTPFALTTFQECQNVSISCITNEVHCIEKSECNTYLKLTSCQIDKLGNKCYWDYNNQNCVTANECQQLENADTDEKCRSLNPICTAELGRGCQMSGINCSDQTSYVSCVWNRDKTQDCYWNWIKFLCVDKICDNAPLSLKTDVDCQGFRLDGSCIAKQGGGCISNGQITHSKQCSDAPFNYDSNSQCKSFLSNCITNGEGCIENIQTSCSQAPLVYFTYRLCFEFLSSCTVNADYSGCEDKTCDNAPSTLSLNEDCEAYFPFNHCVTKEGGGCMTNGACSSLGESACVVDINGHICFWNDNNCVDKTCVNAPITNETHELCQAYSTNCTINEQESGCVDYTCENSQSQDICIKDYMGQTCIYNEGCYQKQCSRASLSIVTYQDCQAYLPTCILSNTGYGCVHIPLTCLAITIKAACIYKQTINGRSECGWNGLECIDKNCTTLDKSLNKTINCNAALSGCVSANPINGRVYGCIKLPDNCSVRQTQDNCEVTGSILCIWNSYILACIKKTCSTATVIGTTDLLQSISQSDCAGYLDGCTISDDGQSCIAKAASCSFYHSALNCIDKAKNNGDDCYWISETQTCVDKICANIPLKIHSDCQNILNTCTVNYVAAINKSTQCQEYAACTNYIIAHQCHINQYNKYCTWTGTQCRDSICSDAPGTIDYDSVAECENYQVSSGICTVYASYQTGCMSKLKSCRMYYQSEACQQDSYNNDCIWINNQCWQQSKFTCSNIQGITFNLINCQETYSRCKANIDGTACIAKSCSDYSTTNGITGNPGISLDSDCFNIDPTCTIDNNIDSVRCQTRAPICSAYTTSGSCTVATEGACVWDGNYCVIATTPCSHFIGDSDQMCSSFRPFCTVVIEGILGACISRNCSDKTGWYGSITDTICQLYDLTCIVNIDSSACIANNTVACSSFVGADDVTCATFRPFCTVATDGTLGPCTDHACADKTGSNLTYDICQQYDSTCSVNADGTGCVIRQATCDLYSTTLISCVHSSSGLCGNDGTYCVVPSATNCSYYTGTGLTDANCNTYHSACIANRAGTACSVKQATCSSYFLADCTRSATTECIGTDDTTGNCIEVSATTTCNDIYLGFGNYTQANCTLKNSLCTNNSTTACQDKTCANAASATSFADCNSWLNSCTWNGTNACITIQATCAAQVSEMCYNAIEGDCVVIVNQCVKKTCENAPATINSHDFCNQYLPACTINREGGCIPRQQCNLYTSQTQCGSKNTTGKSCYWSSNGCLDLTCENIDQTSNYNTHSACNQILNTCTVRSYNDAVTDGCQSLRTCAQYTIQEQCFINTLQQPCEWNINLDIPACVDKSCTTAPNTLNEHSACQNYFGENICTVAIIPGNNGIPDPLGGCRLIGPCSTYIDAKQCQINEAGGKCGWNGTVCADFACSTSPSLNDTDSLCQIYKTGCTVNQNLSGCMDLLSECEEYQIEQNCIKNSVGKTCYWDSTKNVCITKTCANAPDINQCTTYLATCANDNLKCKIKICEDYFFQTDQLCKTAFPNCTTDGVQCVLRGKCIEALSQEGCVTNNQGEQCEWITEDTDSPYCTLKACSTASTQLYKTEEQCALYFTNCTAKQNGGCVNKTTCVAANIQDACTTALDGTSCQWDDITNSCRNKICQDYRGSTHQECLNLSSHCTIGENGNCSEFGLCSEITVKVACSYGLDGPCLWIRNACYLYTSCESIAWTTDQQCKQISQNCTTNGKTCVGITLCEETNTNGGCVTGYDGPCFQFVKELNSVDAPVCKLFTTCADAFYITHQQRQNCNISCTTDGSTGCIPLAKCESYNQAGCFRDSKGLGIQNNQVQSTGICVWDNNLEICRNQDCQDFRGINHFECSSQLSKCTSDGDICINKQKCSTYPEKQCQIAQGTDGICLWQPVTQIFATAQCRVQQCADISSQDFLIGISTYDCQTVLEGCVSDGSKCIPKANCSTYTTKIACNSGGLDGFCIFTPFNTSGFPAGKCLKQSSCQEANNDQLACITVKDRCQWDQTQNKCLDYTCKSKQYNNVCNNYLNFAQTQQQICLLLDGECTESSLDQLDSTNCYKSTNYSYIWSSINSTCISCSGSNMSNSSGQTFPPDSQQTNSGYKLLFMVFIYCNFFY